MEELVRQLEDLEGEAARYAKEKQEAVAAVRRALGEGAGCVDEPKPLPAANDSSSGDSSGAVVGHADCDADLLQTVAPFCERHAALQVADLSTASSATYGSFSCI